MGFQLALKLKAQRSADFWVPIGASKRVVRFGRVDAGDREEIFLSQRAFFPVDPMAEPNTCLKHELGRVFDYDTFRLHHGLQDRWLAAAERLLRALG